MKKINKGKGDRRTDLHTLAATPLPTIVNHPFLFQQVQPPFPVLQIAGHRTRERSNNGRERVGSKAPFSLSFFKTPVIKTHKNSTSFHTHSSQKKKPPTTHDDPDSISKLTSPNFVYLESN
ncbi:unnamed protein product [Camellia sinensis]